MSITPKSHVMADHSIEQLVRTCGFACLGEDAGARETIKMRLRLIDVLELSATTRERSLLRARMSLGRRILLSKKRLLS
jgi:hypothetical protein